MQKKISFFLLFLALLLVVLLRVSQVSEAEENISGWYFHH